MLPHLDCYFWEVVRVAQLGGDVEPASYGVQGMRHIL